MGFIDSSGRPTADYRLLKNPSKAKGAVAAGIKRAYAPLFEANETANALSQEALRGLISQVAGTDEEMTKRIAYTFIALTKAGDFKSITTAAAAAPVVEEDESDDGNEVPDPKVKTKLDGSGLRTEFHYNLQIHLPANGTEETYLNIFNSLRKVFQ